MAFNVSISHEEQFLLDRLKELEDFENDSITRAARRRLFDRLDEVRQSAMRAFSADHHSDRHIEEGINRHVSEDGMVASVDIVSKRKRSAPRARYQAGRKLHRHVSGRTKQLQSYTGADAQFIMRFLNQGTDIRTAGNRVGLTGRGSKATYGYRGQIADGGDYLGKQSARFEQVAQQYADDLISSIEKALNNGK